MNHTTNYDLPQWEDTDRILREDMNGAMSIIDAAMASGVRIETFTYVGNASPENLVSTEITFSEKPTLFLILGFNSFLVGCRAYAYSLTQVEELNSKMAVFFPFWMENTVSFYSSSCEREMNKLGETYHVFAFYQ